VSLAELNPEGRGVFVQKQRANVYTMLLVIALLEIVVGCLCLYLQMNTYQFKVKVPQGALLSSTPAAAPVAPAPGG
jgi:hypothetical protein